MSKKFIFVIFIYSLSFFSVNANIEIKARTAILQDFSSQEILYEKEADRSIYPASMTKIMTSIIAFDLIKSGDLTLDENLVSKSNYFKKFHDVMKDDFNTPAGISVLFEMAREINSLKKDHKEEEANALGSELKVLSKSLGILQQNPDDFFKAGASLNEEEIDNLIKKRNEARSNRDFKLADEIRDDLLSKGIVLEDKESGTVWKKD